MERGATRTPSLGNTLKAEVCSSSVISAEPNATGRYAGMFEVMPKRCAYSITVLMPTRSASESAAQGDGALKSGVVVARRIRAGGSLKSNRRIHDGVVGAATMVVHGGVDIRLERRPDLAQSLRGAVEFGEVEVTAADHGLDFSGCVIDGDERSFGP